MPSLSRKERKRKETHPKKTAQEYLSGDAELLSGNLTSHDVAKPVTEEDMSVAELNDTKDDDGTSNVVQAEHQLEEVLAELGEKVLAENNDPSENVEAAAFSQGSAELGEKVLAENNDPSENVEAAAFSQGSLEDIFTSTPPVNSEDDALEITPNPPSKKKVKRTKKHTHECPQNPSRKLLFGSSKKEGKKSSKKTSYRTKRKRDSRKKFQDRDIPQQGVWVQCDNFRCRKWRFLSSVTDPAKVEQNWTCAMHPDDTFNSCDKPEEDYTDLEFIHNQFTEGSIVWAKMQGYPWWPAMVESDPDTGCFMEHKGVETEVTHYHCVFLDKTVSRSWVPAVFVKTFERGGNPPGSLILKKKCYSKQVMPAKERALDALNLPLKERIQRYGFGKTFNLKGVWKEKKSRENSSPCQDSAHLEEALEIDADDVLGDMLSSEDMEELMNGTEGLMAKAEEAVQEMSDDENILGKATCEEKRTIKHSRKRKPSKCDDESKVKRKKHKKKKSKHDKARKVRSNEKKKRKRPIKESDVEDEVKLDDGENIQDDKKLSFKIEIKECQKLLNMEKKMGSDNEIEELNHVMQNEEDHDSAEDDQKEMKGEKDNGSCDEGDEENEKVKENEVGNCIDTNEMKKKADDMPALSNEKIDDRSDNKVDGEFDEGGGKDSHNAHKGAKDMKVKVKKDQTTTKTKREEKRKEKELKRQLALEEKERKMKEKEMEKLRKQKEKQEKEEKKKEREMKKQEALEEKERKKKARIGKSDKAVKKAKKLKILPESSGETHKDDSEKTPEKATGDAKDGEDAKAKKPKFSVPKGKPNAFVPPGGKPKTAIPTEHRAKAVTHPSQTSVVDVDRDKTKGEGDVAIPLNESSVPTDEESKGVVENSGKEKSCLITNEKMKDSGIAPKLKKKKFSVKRKELSSNNAAKVKCEKSSMEATPNSVPITTTNDSESHGGKVDGKLDSKKENMPISNKDITERLPKDSHVAIKFSVLENKCSDACGEVGRDTKEFVEKKNCRVQGGDGSRQIKQDQEVNAFDNEDVLDLEWSEAPEIAGKKSFLTSVNDEDSDPFEAVEE